MAAATTDIVLYTPEEPQEAIPRYIDEEPESENFYGGRGRPKFLDDSDNVELFAVAVADGWTNKQLANHFHVGLRSCSTYRKDPRVKAAAFKYMQERTLLITRKTDSEIERRLEDAKEMDVIELLKIRKEFLGGAFRTQAEGGKADDRTVTEAMDELEGNPDLAAKLLDLLGGKAPKAAV